MSVTGTPASIPEPLPRNSGGGLGYRSPTACIYDQLAETCESKMVEGIRIRTCKQFPAFYHVSAQRRVSSVSCVGF